MAIVTPASRVFLPSGQDTYGFLGVVKQVHKTGKLIKYRVRIETNDDENFCEGYFDRSELWKVIK